MNAVSIYPVKVEDLTARDSSIHAPSALALSANGKRRYEHNEGKGLLGRMYPGLSREQAVSVVHQKIMVEHLRQVVRTRKRRLHELSSI